jgi:cytochrome P450
MIPTLDPELAKIVIDPRSYAEDTVLHRTLAQIRRESPVARLNAGHIDPFWLVTKHADILEISRNNRLFHNGDRPVTLTARDIETKVRKQTGGSPHLVRTLVQMDEPDHMKFRALTQGWFMPANVRKREDAIRKIARSFVDRLADKANGGTGECDFVRDVALHYPLRVIMEILGVPEADEARMLKLTQELFGARDPDLNRDGKVVGAEDFDAVLAGIQVVFADFFKYFDGITQDRRKAPKDDVSTIIANGQINGAPIPPFEAMSYYVIIATAGHDTTSASTAGALWALCETPGELAKVKANPALISGLVDESIRWVTPVKHFMRTATDDTELRGIKIAKGDWLMLSYPSGNRDEEVFEDPFVFRSDRSPNKHLAFGYGAHLCLGQHLAKLEMGILWEELLPRLKSVELAGEPRRTVANFVGGPKRLPIRYRMV